jgi:hypothetical protein
MNSNLLVNLTLTNAQQTINKRFANEKTAANTLNKNAQLAHDER